MAFPSVFTVETVPSSTASVMVGPGEQKERQAGEREDRLRWHSERETDKRLTTRSGKIPSSGTEAGKVWETENSTISEM